jgi:hypothetical protein
MKFKLTLMQISSFITSLAPLGVGIGLNFDDYVKTEASAIGLTVGGVVTAIFVLMATLGKLHTPKRIWVFAFIFAMAWALEPLILNLKMLSFLALAGEGVNLGLWEWQITGLKKQIDRKEQADTTAESMTEAVKAWKGMV